MTKIEITIQNGRITWMEQNGESLPDGAWAEMNIAVKKILEKYQS